MYYTLAKQRFRGGAMPVVYLDVVWLINFVMDGVILYTTVWIARRPSRAYRIALAALVGSLYALLLFVPRLSLLTTWPGKAVASLCIIRVAIPVRSWLDLARMAVLFYFVAFVYAGAAVALQFVLPGITIARGLLVSGQHLAFLTSLRSLSLLVAIPVGAATFRYSVTRVRRMRQAASSVVTVTAVVAGQAVTFRGLVDTGNQLRDPVSRKPVCLVEAATLAPLLPQVLSAAALAGEDVVQALGLVEDRAWVTRCSVIPYRGAGGSMQMTVAIRPDTVTFEQGGLRQSALTACLLAIHSTALTSDNRFQAILHTEVIAGDDELERPVDEPPQPQGPYSDATAVGPDPPDTGRWS